MTLTARRSRVSPVTSPSPTASSPLSYKPAGRDDDDVHSRNSNQTFTCNRSPQCPASGVVKNNDEVQSPFIEADLPSGYFVLPRRLYLYGLIDCYRAREKLEEESISDAADCDAIEEDYDFTMIISTERIRHIYFKARGMPLLLLLL